MKIFRNIIYVIIAMILGILINVLSFTLIFKDVVQDGVITNVVKTTVASAYLSKNISNLDNLSADQKKMLEDFLNDSEMNEVVDVLMDNYINYISDSNYKISQKDVDKIKDYAVKNEDLIKKISNKDIDINEITKEITVENIDKGAKELQEKFDNMPIEMAPVVSSYKYITVGPLKAILISAIIVCIALMMLISWSLIKWMKSTGVCLITNGILVSLTFVFIDGIKGFIINRLNNASIFEGMTFNNILIIGLSELGIGIILVIIYNILNKKIINDNKEELKTEEKPIELEETTNDTN